MYSFKNDYAEGCHPKILAALSECNLQQRAGYGLDAFCSKAAAMIRAAAECPQAKVHFVSGGTQSNLTVIAALLRPHESVISAATGHIATNETGAIEACGHKVHTVETLDGKLRPAHITHVLEAHQNQPHQLKPKLVYISNATEVGTHYHLEELTMLSQFCKKQNLYLFMDGARLAQALVVENGDLTLSDVARLTDVFYLGGTKNGALLGEAIVLSNPDLQDDFAFHIKQRGGLLAKGSLLGLQFSTLFKEDLYFALAKHANKQAQKIKQAFLQRNIAFLNDALTNQLFPILSRSQISHLQQDFDFLIWKRIDEQLSAIRIIASWATPDEPVDAFCEAIRSMPEK